MPGGRRSRLAYQQPNRLNKIGDSNFQRLAWHSEYIGYKQINWQVKLLSLAAYFAALTHGSNHPERNRGRLGMSASLPVGPVGLAEAEARRAPDVSACEPCHSMYFARNKCSNIRTQ